MIGTFYNVGTIVVGSALGAWFKNRLTAKFHESLMQAMGLAAMCVGVSTVITNMPASRYPVLFMASLALGALVGTALDLDERFNRLLARVGGHGDLAEGVATAILLFCIGTLSIVGPIQAALSHDYTFLFTNGSLIFVVAMVLASNFGFGIAWSSVVLFFWQGAIYLIALSLRSAIPDALITELSIVGGALIVASGITLLGLKPIKTLNLLPALAVPMLFFAALALMKIIG